MLATQPQAEVLVANREEAPVVQDAVSPMWDKKTPLSQEIALAAVALADLQDSRPRTDNGQDTTNILPTTDKQAITTARSLKHKSDRTEDQRMLLMVQHRQIHRNTITTTMDPCPAQLVRKTIHPR